MTKPRKKKLVPKKKKPGKRLKPKAKAKKKATPKPKRKLKVAPKVREKKDPVKIPTLPVKGAPDVSDLLEIIGLKAELELATWASSVGVNWEDPGYFEPIKPPKVEVLPGKPGPKTWIPTPEDITRIEQFASQGLTKEQIARSLGIAPSTFFLRAKTIPEISMAYKDGAAKGIALVANRLFKNATTAREGKPFGDTTSQIFYLKARAGWRDRQEVTVGEPEKPLEHLEKTENDPETTAEILKILDEAGELERLPPPPDSPKT